jgi:hypothetical protein
MNKYLAIKKIVAALALVCKVNSMGKQRVCIVNVFFPNLPVIYSLALQREPPDVLRGSLCAQRTLFEGF